MVAAEDADDHRERSRLKTVSLTSDDAATTPEPSEADVWVHIYHCDPYTGFLNQALLSRAEIGIYHAGVEVFGEEWSFQYYEDTWRDPSVTGLVRCLPRRMADYDYQESVNLGPTPLSQAVVVDILRALHAEWPACSYHLTHNNCLTFAEYFAGKLRPPQPFPTHLKGILEASKQNSSVDAVVDYSWSWVKWWMMRRHDQEMSSRLAAVAPQGQQQGCGSWPGLFQCTCSNTLCLPGPKRDGLDAADAQPGKAAAASTTPGRPPERPGPAPLG